MPTSSLNISLPEPLKAYVEAQAESGDYGTPGEFVRDLIREDRDRRRRNLVEHLLEALKHEAEAFEISDEDWEHRDIVGVLEGRLKERG
jgi:antitoxin ParD1/3/4